MTKLKLCFTAMLIGLGSPSAYALNFNIDYSYDTNNFFSTQTRKDAFEAAANYYGSRISDNLLAIDSSGFNHFNAKFFNPANDALTTLNDFDVAANTLTIFVGGRDLGTSTLGMGGPGGYSMSGTQSFFDAALSRGQGHGTQSAVTGTTAHDFAPWGGSISFDSNSNWYFDSDTSTDETFSGFDFFSVALHEIGHLLGFGIADSWNNYVVGTAFTGPESATVYGNSVPVTSDSAHWANGTMSDGRETAFDPTIAGGVRKIPTSLDLAALKDIGWQVNITAVPVPGAVWLFGSALLGLGGLSRRRGTSLN
ncbi:MAG: matrixin family metalloprotease [Methylomonas sp.]|nr:matrixin family metalloprotease [Methylomonas sp.]